MPRWKTAGKAVVGGALALWLVLAGHEQLTGERPRPGPTEPAPAPDAMHEVWGREIAGRGELPQVVWSTDTTLVLRRGRVLSGHRLSDGARVWAKEPPRGADGICELSPGANAAGVAAVTYLMHGTGCSRLEAVDTAGGKQLWTAALEAAPERQWDTPVVTRRLLVAGVRDDDGRRSRIARLALADGGTLAPVRPQPRCALDWSDYSAANIVLGLSCAKPPRARLAVHATATGGQRWTTGTHARRGQEALVADEPLTLLQAEGSGARSRLLLQTYDSEGTPLRRLDDVVDDRDWSPLRNYWYVDGAVAVVRRNSGIAAHDLNTGVRLWSYTSGDILGLVGVRDGRALVDACPRDPPAYACFTELGLTDGRDRRAGTIPEPGPRSSHPLKTFHYPPGGDVVIELQRDNGPPVIRMTAYRLLTG